MPVTTPAPTPPADSTPAKPTPAPTPPAMPVTSPAPTPPAASTPAAPVTTPAPTPPAVGTPATPVTDPCPMPPTAGTPITPVTTPAPTPAPVRPTHPLTGRGTGTFQATRVNPDVGTEFKFQGTAQMAALGGPVAVAGDLHTPGNIADGLTTGTLTVSTKTGSVTVALTSFRPPVAVGAPIWYRYRVTAGTGSLVGLQDTGSLRLDWVPAPILDPPMTATSPTPAAPATSPAATSTATNSGTAPTTTPAGTTSVTTGTPAAAPAQPDPVIVQRGTFRLTV